MRVDFYMLLIQVIVSYTPPLINGWKLIKTKTLNISVESSTLQTPNNGKIGLLNTNKGIGLHPTESEEIYDIKDESMTTVAFKTDITVVESNTEVTKTSEASMETVTTDNTVIESNTEITKTSKASMETVTTDVTVIENIKKVDDKEPVTVKAKVAVTSEKLDWYPDGFKSGYPNWPNSFVSTSHTMTNEDQKSPVEIKRVVRTNNDENNNNEKNSSPFLDDFKKALLQSIPANLVLIFCIIAYVGMKCLIKKVVT